MIQAIYNAVAGELTILAPGQASASVSIAGTAATVALTNGQGTLPISLHASVSGAIVQATVNGTDAAISADQMVLNLGGPAQQPGGDPLQFIAPVAPATIWNVYPKHKATLRAYHSGLLNPAQSADAQTGALQDLYSIVGLLLHLVGQHIIPTLQQATWAPLTLDANQTNAVNDLTNSVLPDLAVTLENLYPSGGSAIEVYSELKARVTKYQTSINNYMSDIAAIPNLV